PAVAGSPCAASPAAPACSARWDIAASSEGTRSLGTPTSPTGYGCGPDGSSRSLGSPAGSPHSHSQRSKASRRAAPAAGPPPARPIAGLSRSADDAGGIPRIQPALIVLV